MESTGRVVWQVILGLMVISVPLGLLIRQRRVRRMERSITRGLRELLDPPGMRASPTGPRVCPDHPVYRRRPTREQRNAMWE